MPRVRAALATWLALYPLLTLMLWTLEEPLSWLPLPVRTLALTLFLVPVLTFGLVPRVQVLLDRVIPTTAGGGPRPEQRPDGD